MGGCVSISKILEVRRGQGKFSENVQTRKTRSGVFDESASSSRGRRRSPLSRGDHESQLSDEELEHQRALAKGQAQLDEIRRENRRLKLRVIELGVTQNDIKALGSEPRVWIGVLFHNVIRSQRRAKVKLKREAERDKESGGTEDEGEKEGGVKEGTEKSRETEGKENSGGNGSEESGGERESEGKGRRVKGTTRRRLKVE
ncbi:hypothetical protein C8F04DRAFT_1175779 [Mycena alexandri]|uniref:Uncharacterized protein n=1 Tax=Mycena alexandri TaxID=1745969 RepID=A0AAD6XFH3_9AGAR|nr:hypothetical protein C8F04DRAFT_1175779 [Mycena alexandri]